ncbi:MAG: hypothetical protein R2744_00640 [Bacteroidales bacterium]
MVVTGNRTDDTHVFASVDYFTLSPGEDKTVNITLRKVVKEKRDLGKLDRSIYRYYR